MVRGMCVGFRDVMPSLKISQPPHFVKHDSSATCLVILHEIFITGLARVSLSRGMPGDG